MSHLDSSKLDIVQVVKNFYESVMASPNAKYAGFAILTAVISRIVYLLCKRYSIATHTAKIRRMKLTSQDSQVSLVEAFVRSQPAVLLKKDVVKKLQEFKAASIVSDVKSGKISAISVVITFIRQCVSIHNRCNACTEMVFKRAIDKAIELDTAIKQRTPNSPAQGALCGLPISVKDSVNIAGVDSSLGLTRYCGIPSKQDALCVRILESQGAIVHTKTAVPQTLISFECCNPVFGVSKHLQSPNHTCGGSSGGEALLVAGGGSVVGIGTDIGGSVRIPAHFSGCAAIKPTARRLTNLGLRASVPGQEAVPGVVGVMAMHTSDILLVIRELICEAAWKEDCDLVRMKWNDEMVSSQRPLKFGWYCDDGFVPPSPACARGVTTTVEALQRAGYECLQWIPPDAGRGVALFYALLGCDGAYTITNQLDNEQWEPYVSSLVSAVRMPSFVRNILASILLNILHEERAAEILSAARPRSVTGAWAIHAARKAYKQMFFESWASAGLDLLLTPAHVLPAVKHGDYAKISYTCSFTLLFNLLDAPAGIVPVTTVESTDVYTNKPRDALESRARACYDPKSMQGFPIGVQVVGTPFTDELVLRGMNIIEKLNLYKRPSVRSESEIK